MSTLKSIPSNKWFRRVLFLAIGAFILFAAYLALFLYYMIKTDHIDEAYKKYCDYHIELLEVYHQNYHTYPERLDLLDRKDVDPNYIKKDCGYRHSKDTFSFSIQNGFGVAGYESWKKKWWFD